MIIKQNFIRNLTSKQRLTIGIVIVLVLLFLGGIFLESRLQRQVQPSTNEEQVEVDTSDKVVLEQLVDEGEVLVLAASSSQWEQASDGQIVTPGSRVKTDEKAKVQLVYPNGTATRVDSESEVKLTSFEAEQQKVSVYLYLGRIWSRVSRLIGTGSSYEAETDTVVATVRGTSFGIEKRSDGTNEVLVTESAVDCECKDVDQDWAVGENWKADFSCKEGEEVVAAEITDADMEDEWFVFNKDQDEKLDERFGKEHFRKENEDKEDGSHVMGIEHENEDTPTLIPTPTLSPTPTESPSTPTPTCAGRKDACDKKQGSKEDNGSDKSQSGCGNFLNCWPSKKKRLQDL
jgi:hypothetical protein